MIENLRGRRPVRVAIVGGGCAGMAAAWHLSRQPGYEVHVYEKSWRLGGKGASVRDDQGRILDHGLHVWLGFYENAFRMMRDCYDEIERRQWGPHPEATEKLAHRRLFNDAFFPEPHIGVVRPGGDWVTWSGYFPPAKGRPGEPLDDDSNPFTIANYLLRCFDLLKTLMLSVIANPEDEVPGEPRPQQRSRLDESINLDFSIDTTRSLPLLIERMTGLLRGGTLTGAAVLLQAVTIVETWLQQLNFVPQAPDSIIQLMVAIAAQTRKLLFDFVAIDDKIRMRTEIIDILLSIAVGLFRDRVLFDKNGLDSINHFDYREWLLQHGATKTSVQSRFVTGAYDLVFAYREGDRERPALAAGVALRGALRMFFTYRGSMFWRIRSGMGDAVFAPLYKVMKANDARRERPQSTLPVTFHFLHELESVAFNLSVDGRAYLSTLTFRTQGNPRLLDKCSARALDDQGSWPKSPVQFKGALGAPRLRRPLVVGKDFDAVIFATGVAEFSRTCISAMRMAGAVKRPQGRAPQRARNIASRWLSMSHHTRTVATQAAQVWLSKDLEGLGWYRGSGLFTALGLSFDTWADMTHTLPVEARWRGRRSSEFDEARSVGYFCAPLAESRIKEEKRERSALGFDLDTCVNELRAKRPADAPVGARDVKRVKQAVAEVITRVRKLRLPGDLERSVDSELNFAERLVLARPKAIGQFLDPIEACLRRIESHLVTPELDALVKDAVKKMLTKEMRPLWPAAFDKGTAQRFQIREDKQHVQANFIESDRYTLSLPGTLSQRISPLDRSVENMTVAGDWTACGLDAGCVEAAVMSGMLAACSISGNPDLRSIVGYDHP